MFAVEGLGAVSFSTQLREERSAGIVRIAGAFTFDFINSSVGATVYVSLVYALFDASGRDILTYGILEAGVREQGARKNAHKT